MPMDPIDEKAVYTKSAARLVAMLEGALVFAQFMGEDTEALLRTQDALEGALAEARMIDWDNKRCTSATRRNK